MTALLVVALVLLAIGLLPVGVWVQFDRGALALRVKVGPFGIPILPKRTPSIKKLSRQAKNRVKLAEKQEKKLAKKQEKKQKKQAKKQAKKAAQPPKEKKKPKLSPAFLLELARIGVGFLGGLRRKLYLPELTVYLCMGGADAAAQAEGYARAWAILGAASPVLDNTFRIGKQDLQAVLDWSVTSTECFARVEARLRVGGVVYLALRAGVQFLKAMLQNKKKAVQTT